MPIARVYEDAGLSGSLSLHDRPGLLEAVSTLRRGDVLLIAKRDRLGRDVVAVAMIERLIEKKGARVVSCAGEGTGGNGPTDMLMRRIIDAFAEYERLVIGARTKAALRAKRERGERTGGIPYGFQLATDRRRLEPHPGEQRVLARLRQLRDAGLTLHAVAEELNREGFRTRRGTLWRYQYVALQLGSTRVPVSHPSSSSDNESHHQSRGPK